MKRKAKKKDPSIHCHICGRRYDKLKSYTWKSGVVGKFKVKTEVRACPKCDIRALNATNLEDIGAIERKKITAILKTFPEDQFLSEEQVMRMLKIDDMIWENHVLLYYVEPKTKKVKYFKKSVIALKRTGNGRICLLNIKSA